MKKIVTAFAILLFVTTLKAQLHSGFNAVPAKPFKGISASGAYSKPNAACDTVNLDVAISEWTPVSYPLGPSGNKGYILGVSNPTKAGGTILEDANFFDVSAGDYNYITGGLAYFAVANSTSDSTFNKSIIFKVYDDSLGKPHNLLGSTNVIFSQVHQDVLDSNLTEFIFSTPIAIPASKTFYISIDHHNFHWNGNGHDSLSIIGTGNGETAEAAFQLINVPLFGLLWIPVDQFWILHNHPLEINLFVFPYVSNSSDGCGVLPVSLFNFGGSIKNSQAYLNWSTATESNNKGFYVERSKDGQNFASIGFVKGVGNSSKITNYTYTDYLLKDLNVTTTYYRLKQVDLDGKYSYSKVLPLNMKNLFQYRLYPNPVKDVATVELSLETASKVNVQVISHDGKIVLNSDKGVMTQGTQQVFINTQNLAKGTYIAHVTAGDKTYNVPFVKE